MHENVNYVDFVFKFLHENPEPSLEEYKTSRFLADELIKFGYNVEKEVGITGIIGTLDSGNSGPILGVRADMDALPFDVNGEEKYIHACGHDAHCAIVLSTAKLIAEEGISKGKNGYKK